MQLDQTISMSSLKRRLREMGLTRKYRKREQSVLYDVISALIRELSGSGDCIGHNTMWKRLKRDYGLQVHRKTVLQLMWIMDPEGMAARKSGNFKKRVYVVPGPDHQWHIDGWDKTGEFGFRLHGCEDGFTRKIIWLELGTTNKNSGVIARYYLDTVQKLDYVPRVMQIDPGVENAKIKVLQKMFRMDSTDEFNGHNSVIEGSSTCNTKIESYWGFFWTGWRRFLHSKF